MDKPAEHHQQHQFFMPAPVQVPVPQQPLHHQQQQLCVPTMTMMDEPSSFLAGSGGEGASSPARGRTERKRRFTEEQIRSLESTFHARQAKLEPREKAELARDLGLQPRQVAIWFQNKRARWRSKQLEHDYALLRAKFDDLHARVDALRQDKLTLTTQLKELSERLREREDRAVAGGGATTASSSSCNGGVGVGDEEAEDDDKRNVVFGCGGVDDIVEPPPESCVLVGSCTTPADVVSVESECDEHLQQQQQHLDYDDDDGFPESYCAMPELWEPWPLVEWNAVA